MSRGTNMDESWHIWMSHDTYESESSVTRIDESCHPYEWVMSPIWVSHVTRINELYDTCEWVMALQKQKRHVAHMDEIYHIFNVCKSNLTHEYVCHDSLICVPWLLHMFAMTPLRSYVCHDSFTFVCVPWHICIRMCLHLCHDSFLLIHMCDMTPSYVRQDSFICVTWLMHTCAMTNSHACHDSFICGPWLIYIRMCAMTHLHSYVFTHVSWLFLHACAPRLNAVQHEREPHPHSPTHLHPHSPTHSHPRSPTDSHAHLPTRSHPHSLPLHSLTHPTQPISLTHSFTHTRYRTPRHTHSHTHYPWIVETMTLMRAESVLYMCVMTPSYAPWLICMCAMTRSYAPWLIDRLIAKLGYSEAIICMTLDNSSRMHETEVIWMSHDTYEWVSWLIHMCHDSFISWQ